MREIAKAGAKAAILQGIEADQKAEAEAEAARLLSLAEAKGFDTWEAAQQAEEAEAERKQGGCGRGHPDSGRSQAWPHHRDDRV